MMAAMLLGGAQAPEAPDPGPPTVLPYASIDGWNVLVDMEAGPTCYVLGAYGAGTVLRLGPDETGLASLVVANASWKGLEAGRSYDSVIRFDDEDAWKGSGTYAEEDGVGTMVFRFADPRFVRGFVEAASMTLKVEGTEMARVRLTGSRKALAAMSLCQGDVDAMGREAEGGEAPPATGRTT